MISYSEEELKRLSLTDEWPKLKEEFYTLQKLVSTLQAARNKRLREEEKEKHVQACKKVKPFAVVYFVSNNTPEIPYGTPMTKVKDMRDQMLCQVGTGKWKISYHNISINQPALSQIDANRQLRALIPHT